MDASSEMRRQSHAMLQILEQQWFDRTNILPETRLAIPDASSSIKKFQSLIWDNVATANISPYGANADELSRLAADGDRGWLSSDHVDWVLGHIDKNVPGVIALCPSSVCDIKQDMERRLQYKTSINRLILAANVGKSIQGTFFGKYGRLGCHWVLIIVDMLPDKHIYYCDTLAWDAPSDLLSVINEYASHVPNIGQFENCHVTLAHNHLPHGNDSCSQTCLNYPMQTCSDICGVITLVMAAIAAGMSEYFDTMFLQTNKQSKLYLHQPTKFSHHLRSVLMAWFAEKNIVLDYVVPPHTFCNIGNSDTLVSRPNVKCAKRSHLLPSVPSVIPNKQMKFDPPRFQDSHLTDPQPKLKSKLSLRKLTIFVPGSSTESSLSHLQAPNSQLKAHNASLSTSTLKSPSLVSILRPQNSPLSTFPNQLVSHFISDPETPKCDAGVMSYENFDCSCNIPSRLTRLKLIQHLNTEHEYDIAVNSTSFSSFDEFKDWKNYNEKGSNMSFVKQRGNRLTTNNTTSAHYMCHWSGQYKSRGSGKRALKSQGSCKSGSFCPAFISAKILSTGLVNVTYCFQHVGHRLETAFTCLSEAIRSKIAGQLLQGVAMTTIIDQIRDDVSGQVNTRDLIVSKADLHNIKHQYNISSIKRSEDDAESVNIWVKELQEGEYNPILYFKQLGHESTEPGVLADDFILAFQTKFQKKMFQDFAHKAVCMDSTHGTNAYQFQLITVMVIDDYSEGIPVAWLISTREATEILKVFFASLKAVCGQCKSNVFMSDDADQFYNAWCATFAKPDHKLLCSWHVERSWHRQIKMKDPNLETQVLACMKRLQNEPDEAKFRQLLQQFLSWIQTVSQPIFHYFNNTYVKRIRQWAACFRVGSQFNTNMYVESFHRTLKHIYFDRKQNRRVDLLIYKLNKIARDKFVEQISKVLKGKITRKNRECMKIHDKAENLKDKAIIKMISCNSWSVNLNAGEFEYIIKKVNNDKCNCYNQCKKCNTCAHTFQCTCREYVTHKIVCLHIHVINIVLFADTFFNKSNTDENNNLSCENRQELNRLMATKQTQHKDFNPEKNVLQEYLSKLTNLIASSKEAYRYTLPYIKGAIAILERETNENKSFVTTKFIAANKLSERQPSFISKKNKKKYINPYNIVSQSTLNTLRNIEIKVCAFCLKEEIGDESSEYIDWIECSNCKAWLHQVCDFVEDVENFTCSMCRN